MKIAVITATKRYGGLDVTFESLIRQTLKPHVWIISDELQYRRMNLVMDHAKQAIEAKQLRSVEHFESCERPDGYYSNLPAIYNQMLGRAIDHGCDYAVSLQDYICIPSNGLEQFAEAAQERPGALLTGLCSMSRYPDASCVKDPKGLWTVFEEPFGAEGLRAANTELEWTDVRTKFYRNPGLNQTDARTWEMNWAMIPLDLVKKGVMFDETYGEHIGHENVQFAWSAMLREDRPVFGQPSNHAISLPHRHYFEDEWEEQQKHRLANMHYHKTLYGQVENLRSGRA